MGSKGSSNVRSIPAVNGFPAGTSHFNAPSHSTNNASSRNERVKSPVQTLNRQVDGFSSNSQTVNRQRFQATPIPGRTFNTSNPSPRQTGPVLNLAKPSGSAVGSSSRRFVPPTPVRQTSNQVPLRPGAQQQRAQSQLKMPPPPLPGTPRFR
jgi:hypothetical protein